MERSLYSIMTELLPTKFTLKKLNFELHSRFDINIVIYFQL